MQEAIVSPSRLIDSNEIEAVMTAEDFLGQIVRDVEHKNVGIVDEVFCSPLDHSVRYVKVMCGEDAYLYPFELLVWNGSGPVFLSSKLKDLKSMGCYDPMFVMEGEELITYDELIEMEIEEYMEPEFRSLAS